MDTPSSDKNSKQSNSSSSGCSASSSTTDIKNSYKSQRLDNKSTGMRSKSFLHCLSKHLGRHFTQHHQHQHHHHHTLQHNGQTVVYNSQEDLRSSSTDSFSLSYERNSRLDGRNSDSQQETATSSFDMSGSDEPTSRASSTSASSRLSPEQDDRDNACKNQYNNKQQQQQHMCRSTTIYRPNSSLDCQDDLEEDYSESDSGNSSSDEQENVANNENVFNENLTTNKSKSSPASVANTPSNSLTTSASKGLHLSRISITSSVRSIFQHISSVSASSTRSLSCSSTPLKRVWDAKCKKSNSIPSTTATANAKSNKSSKSSASNTRSSSTTASQKTEKKQQSILRPPMNYVYTKGMSGLYSRVPRYTVCCQYNNQQWA